MSVVIDNRYELLIPILPFGTVLLDFVESFGHPKILLEVLERGLSPRKTQSKYSLFGKRLFLMLFVCI